MKQNKATACLGLLAGILMVMGVVATSAQAHTTSIGFVPGTVFGDVTFWTGSYFHGGTVVNEGSITLTGTSGAALGFGSVTQDFDIAPVSLKPTGLVDGTNNFYWPDGFGSPLDMSLTSDPGIAGGVVFWQGTTFSGLVAGTYDFSCGAGGLDCGDTAQWDDWGPGTESITLTTADITPVPEPASMILFGSGLIGLAAWRRFKKNA